MIIYIILVRAVGKTMWFNSGELFDTLYAANTANKFNRSPAYQYRVTAVEVELPHD